MYYLVYRITNIINGKTYVGRHTTLDKNDGYMGSGYALKSAKKKYGLENFSKEILCECASEQDMFYKERELVVLGPDSYNLIAGGSGGYRFPRGPFTEEHKQKLRLSHIGHKPTLAHRKKLSEAAKGKSRGTERPEITARRAAKLKGRKLSQKHIANRTASILGTKRSIETRMRMSEAAKLREYKKREAIK